MNLSKKIREEVIAWNNKFPVDLWWRKKHKIPFGSKKHKQMNFLDMLFEFEEEKILNENANKGKNNNNEISEVPPEKLEQDFEDLDIDDFN